MRNVILTGSDLRALPAVNALNVTMAKRPRTRAKASDCIVTRADGTQYVIAARNNSNKPRTVKPRATGYDAVDLANLRDRHHRITAADLAAVGTWAN